MSWMIDERFLETAEQEREEQRKQFSIPETGIYEVKLQAVYLVKSKNGATGFEVVAETKDGKKLQDTYWIETRNGKKTYTDKNGKEQPLPGWFPVNHLIKLCNVKNLQPQRVTVERFGNPEEVGLLKDFEGCIVKAIVRQYEDEYNGEIRVKYAIEEWLDKNGNDYKGEPAEEKWRKVLEKNPIKKMKKKKEESKEEVIKTISDW